MFDLEARQRRSKHGRGSPEATARAIFDSGYYVRRNPDVAKQEPDPFMHYVRTGWAEGRNPSPLFDTDFYLSRYSDVADRGHNPLLHYVSWGASEGRSPSPLFSQDWYLARNPDASAASNPLLHYLTVGALQGQSPNPLFDADWYVRQTNIDPNEWPIAIAHYVEFGARNGASPHPLFDPRWYIKKHSDVAADGRDPLSHYLISKGENRRAHPLFDGEWYRTTYRDVAQPDIDPLLHYLETGGREDRRPHPLFDVDFYRKQSNEAAAAPNPLIHYLKAGAAQGLQPHPSFDSEWYLQTYPDVARSGLNPLVHFITEGREKGYSPNPEGLSPFDSEAAPAAPARAIDAAPAYAKLAPFVPGIGVAGSPKEPSPRAKPVDAAPASPAVGATRPAAERLADAKASAAKVIAKNQDARQSPPQQPGPSAGASGPASPKPVVSTSRPSSKSEAYWALRQEVLNSGLWDEDWYLSRYYEDYIASKQKKPGELFFPLDYYLQEGWKRGHEPSNLLPIRIDQKKVGCSKIEHFLNRLRFESYQFDVNLWVPSDDQIADYIRQKQDRRARRVIYTCILDGYDQLMQPYCISPDWDYVCFTDDPALTAHARVGVWEIRPIVNVLATSVRTNRWHKMHPNLLFPEHDESIYVDGNVNVISDYLFREIEQRDTPILLPQHFLRNCIYQEIEILLNRRATSEADRALLTSHREFLERSGFPKQYGLSENNVIYRRHHDPHIVRLMNDWWTTYQQYSSRDQASLAYVFWKRGMALRAHVFPNCRVNYRDFWVMKHCPDLPAATPSSPAPSSLGLAPAFDRDNIAVVFSTNEAFIPYLGVAVYSLIENARSSSNYDIIILAKGLPEELFAKVLGLAEGRDNVSVRLHDTGPLIDALPAGVFHVEGYVPVETYNKCFITEILSPAYDRCVYLDSDILVLGDVQELHDMDLQGRSIGASVNVANVNAAFCKKEIKGRRFDEYLRDDLGVLDHNQYFQAGVVVLDLDKLRGMGLRTRTFETLAKVKKPIFFDQCIFNSIFYEDVCFFSTRWNHVWYMQQYSYLRGSIADDVFFDYAKGRVDPKIIHYAGKDKPQSKLGWTLSDLFWKYAYASPFFQDIQRDILARDNEVSRLLAVKPPSNWYAVRPRLLAHVHLYYRDQLDVMLRALANISGCDVDLYVTMVEQDAEAERRILSEWKNAQVLVLPNAGYDIYPFLDVLRKVRLANYDFILKIHTKNAREPGQDDVYGVKVPGYQWRDDLINALLGSPEIFRANLARLREDKSVGCIGAAQFIFSTEEHNEERNYKLADWRQKCGVDRGTHYIGGSMFFARAYPFERLKGLNIQLKDFAAPNMSTKDCKNLAHVFERLLGIVIEAEGFEISGPASTKRERNL